MRLLLDEMYAPALAAALRDAGIDAKGVSEDALLWGLPDADVWALAQREGRAVVTEDVADFLRLEAWWRSRGDRHCGLLVLRRERLLRRHDAAVRVAAERLVALLEHRSPEELVDLVQWV